MCVSEKKTVKLPINGLVFLKFLSNQIKGTQYKNEKIQKVQSTASKFESYPSMNQVIFNRKRVLLNCNCLI